MQARLGPDAPARSRRWRYGEPLDIGGVAVRLVPAGHILGSAQVVLEHKGARAVVSGDYKRRPDPTCGAVRAGPVRSVRHRGDVRAAGVPARERRARDRPAARVGARVRRPHASRRRLRPRQDAAADRAAARRRLRPANLAARRARVACAGCTPSWACDLGDLELVNDAPRQAAGRDRALPALRPAGPLVAPADRSRHRLRLGLDAGARAARGSAASSCRWSISDHCDWPELVGDHRRHGSRGGVGHARARGRAGASDRADGQARRGRWRWSASRRRASEAFRRSARPPLLQPAATPSCG